MAATILFLVVAYTTVVTHSLDHNTQGIARSYILQKLKFLRMEII